MLRFSSFTRVALAFLAGFVLYSSGSSAESVAVSSPTPAHGLPRILSVDIPTNHTFHAGQTIRGTVETSPNVGYVEARVQYRNKPLHRDGLGKFSLAYTIPWWLPPWLRHDWILQIVARSVDGVEVKEDFPIRVE